MYLIPGGTHTKQATRQIDKKRIRQSDQNAKAKEKKKRQVQDLLRVQQEALREAEGITYEAGAF